MNSFNHYAYGAIGEWLYSYVAGIAVDETKPGFKHILFQPHPGGGLKNAGASILTMYGKAACSWEIVNHRFHLILNVPPNTSASVTLPLAQLEVVQESGKPLQKGKGIQTFYQDGDSVVVELGSGDYFFIYVWK
jgi:alpha-L-rhamnosidase